MRWTDIYNIAIALEESHPTIDIANINFINLQRLVLELNGFNDQAHKCNEKILEAIQTAWLEERF